MVTMVMMFERFSSLWPAKVMKSIDRAWAKIRSLNRELPQELLG